jgi:hypothetical protein
VRTKSLVILLVAAVGALALSGCKASVSVSTSSGPKTYTNHQYGFSMTYDSMFRQGSPAAASGAGGSSVFDVGFANPDGAKVNGKYVDSLEIAVYKLLRVVQPREVTSAKVKQEFDGVVTQMMGGLSSAAILEPLTATEVNGTPGFAFSYTFSDGDTTLKAVTYFLIKGQYEYQITAQATTTHWDGVKSKLQSAVASFKVS